MSTVNEETRGLRKTREGIVISDCQDKTIIVNVERRTAHSLYKKVIKVSKKYYAHDEKNEAKVGDKVAITETKPLSKTKCWRLVSVLSHS